MNHLPFPTSHGGDIYSRHVTFDFSANLNPLGMPEGVKKALTEGMDSFSHYPDVSCAALREAIAAREGCDAERIVCGNGAADMIWRIPPAFRPKRALIPAPTFSEYERALLTFGCEVVRYFTREEDSFALREDFSQSVAGCDVVFVCRPNNPVGNLAARDLLWNLIETCAASGTLLVLDECFIEFTGEKPLAAAGLPGDVILLRAFTKIYAMAGLRLGYAMCSRHETAQRLRDFGPCWSVSVPAQIAGVAALRERGFVEKTVSLIAGERAFLAEGLRGMGLKVFSSRANFLLFRCGLPLDRMLLREGIAIRYCGDYHGLSEQYFRIAVRTREENRILLNAIERCVKNG